MLCYIVKKVQMQSISATYFAIFGRNMEIFSVNLEFKKYGKICTRKTPHLAIFHAVCIENLGYLMWWQTPFTLCLFSLLNFRVYQLFEQMLLRNCNCNKNGNSKLRQRYTDLECFSHFVFTSPSHISTHSYPLLK